MYRQVEMFGNVGAGGYSREDREEQIFEIVSQSTVPVTLRYIAARLGLSKSPYLRSIVRDMVEYGWLEKSEVRMTNGVRAFVYAPAQLPQ